jgi:hypothetical protein
MPKFGKIPEYIDKLNEISIEDRFRYQPKQDPGFLMAMKSTEKSEKAPLSEIFRRKLDGN